MLIFVMVRPGIVHVRTVAESLKNATLGYIVHVCSRPFFFPHREEIESRLSVPPFSNAFVAVRSSGTDEDSAAHSFAGV